MRVNIGDIIQMYCCCWEDAERTAKELGIDRSTVYRWVRRSRSVHGQGHMRHKLLKRKSTRPHRIHCVLTASEENRLRALHTETGFTAIKLKKELDLPCCVSTINRFLKRRGYVRKYGNHRRPYYQKTTHMHLGNTKDVGYVQMDVKYLTPELTGLPWTCFEYAVIDIYSRYKDAVILNHLDEDGAIEALLTLIKRLPFKAVFLQTDNGLEFQKRFKTHAEALQLKHHYVHKRTPNENAVIERSFRTDEEEFFFFRYKGARDYEDLRAQFQQFLTFYNRKRPHLGIKLQYPLQVIHNHLSQMS